MIFPETICFYSCLFVATLILPATVPPPLFFGAIAIFFICRKSFYKPDIKPHYGEFYYLIFLFVLLIETIAAPDFSRPAFVFLRYLFLYLIWQNLQRNTNLKSRQILFNVLLVIAVFMSAGGFYQVFLSAEPMPVSWGDPNGLKRAFGLFDNPNLFASFLMILLTTILFAKKRYLQKPGLNLSIALIILFMLILTQSRGAIIAFCATLCLLLPFVPEKKQIFLFLLLCIGGFFITGRIKTLDKSNLGVNQRLELYQGIRKYIKDNWAWGTSPGSFHLHYPRYRTLGGYYPLYAHNQILETICETGIIGLLPFLAWWFFSGLWALKLARKGIFLPIAIFLACTLNSQVNSSFSLFVTCLIAMFCFCLEIPEPQKNYPNNNGRPYFHILLFGFFFYWLIKEFQAKELIQSPQPLQQLLRKMDTGLKKELAPALFRIEQVINHSEDPEEINAARQWLDELEKIHPHEGEIPFLQARIMLATDQKQSAEKLLIKAMELDYWSEKYAHTLLSLWLYLGKYEEFEKLSARIMKSNPDYLTENPWYKKINELEQLFRRLKQ